MSGSISRQKQRQSHVVGVCLACGSSTEARVAGATENGERVEGSESER